MTSLYLYAAEASFCCGETGEKERRKTWNRPRALSIFGMPNRSICEEESRYTKI